MVGVSQAPQGGGWAAEGSAPSSYERRGQIDIVSAGSAELGDAVGRVPFPLFVWSGDGVVRLANQAGAELIGLPLNQVVGTPMLDRFAPREEVERVISAVFSGAVVGTQAKRVLTRGDGAQIPVWAWSRVFELDGRHAAITLVMPTAQWAALGRDPSTPWRALVPIAVGTADRQWTVKSVTRDVTTLLGFDVGEVVGRRLTELMDPADVGELVGDGGGPPRTPFSVPRVGLAHKGGGWVKVCFLVAPVSKAHTEQMLFAMVGPVPAEWATEERVAELELRLRRIGSEVRAAGLLEQVHNLPAPDHPHMSELTTRQWEILSLLLEGLRVPAIAAQLYLSPSTVRNHLATIFRKFGVHSQSELLELLRRPHDPEAASADP